MTRKGNWFGFLLASCGLFFGVGIGTFNSFFTFFIRNFSELTPDERARVEYNLNFFFVLGGMVVCLVGSPIYERLGRHTAILLMLGAEIAVMLAMAIKNIRLLFALRFCAGFLGCFSTLVAPLLIAETLPELPAKRYGSLFAAFLTGGIFLGYCFNGSWTIELWRVPLMWPLIIEIPKLVLFWRVFDIESPVWMVRNNIPAQGITDNYRKIYNMDEAIRLTDQVMRAHASRQEESFSFGSLMRRDSRIQLFLTVLLNLLNQLTGINFLILYSTAIFEKMQLPHPRLLTMGIGALNFVGCLLLTQLNAVLSMKSLMAWGIFGQALGYCVMLGALAFGVRPLIPLGPYIYILSFGLSLGGLIYLYCATLVPSQALSGCALFQWVFTCLIALYGKQLTDNFPIERIFFVLQAMTTIGGLLFVGFAIDTTDKSPAQIKAEFARKGFFSQDTPSLPAINER